MVTKKTVKKVVAKPKVVKKVSEKHINFLLDETGSMQSIKEKTINDFNEYLQGLKKAKGKAVFTLTKFNAMKVDVVYSGKDVKDIPELTTKTYMPTDGTPLYDAIGKSVKALEKNEKTQEILMVILTDGQENASKEYNFKAITELMKEKETQGWTFVYLGVGQAAWTQGATLGMKNFASTSSTSRAMNIGSGASLAFMQGGSSSTKYFMSKNRK